MEINELQHPDFIWTWKSNSRACKSSLWLPYVDKIEKNKGSKYTFSYKGGEVTCDLKKIDFIMIYGASGHVSIEFLDDLNTHRIPLFIHRRNMDRPLIFYTQPATDDRDVLTPQIKARSNKTTSAYIARTLIAERVKKMNPTLEVSQIFMRKLAAARSVDSVRQLEAEASKKYWEQYYKNIDIEITRRESHPVNDALNAGSKFLYGIMLRWTLFHKLSPSHGFLHVQSTYPSLIYDIMEPYRYIIEIAVSRAHKKGEKNITPNTIDEIKALMEDEVWVPATHQHVRRKNLLHGIVLSLASYLTGETSRFVIPTESKKTGGRPPKVKFNLPGGIHKT